MRAYHVAVRGFNFKLMTYEKVISAPFSAAKFQNLTWINCHTRYVPSFSFVLFLQINILNTFHHNDGLVDQDTLGLSSRGRRRRPPSKLSFFFNYLFSSSSSRPPRRIPARLRVLGPASLPLLHHSRHQRHRLHPRLVWESSLPTGQCQRQLTEGLV